MSGVLDGRYSRQELFAGIGREGQERLAAARVLVAGCGGLGTVSASLLGRAGVGFLRIVDRDVVELSNLQRQALFSEEDVRLARPKAVAAAERLADINHQIVVEARVADIAPASVRALVGDVDLVVDGFDNFEGRYLLNDACVERGIPWVYGACVEARGVAMLMVPGRTPCLRCLYPEPPEPGASPTCDAVGVLGSATHATAALQVAMALRWLVTREVPQPAAMVWVDVWEAHAERLEVAYEPDVEPLPVLRGAPFRLPGRAAAARGGAVRAERGDAAAAVVGTAGPGGPGGTGSRAGRGAGQRAPAAAAERGARADAVRGWADRRQGDGRPVGGPVRRGPAAGGVRRGLWPLTPAQGGVTPLARWGCGFERRWRMVMPIPELAGVPVLVTGGAGFIGSHLVDALVSQGARVVVLDNLATGRLGNLAHHMGPEARARAENGGPLPWVVEGTGITLLLGDIRDAASCRVACGLDALGDRRLPAPAYVFHQAALGSVPRSMKDPATSLAVNVGGTANVLAAARDACVKRVVYASSSSVYGDSPRLPKREGDEGRPLSPYALSKVMDEELADIFGRCFGMELVGLRYFNVFGPRQDPNGPYAAVIPRFFVASTRREAPVVYGDGEQSRDFTFVENVVEANLLAAGASVEACGRAYNVAAGLRTSVNELARRIAETCGDGPEPVHEAPRAGDVRDSLADLTLVGRTLGYEPRVDLAEGLRRTAVDYLPM